MAAHMESGRDSLIGLTRPLQIVVGFSFNVIITLLCLLLVGVVSAAALWAIHHFINRHRRGHFFLKTYARLCGYTLQPKAKELTVEGRELAGLREGSSDEECCQCAPEKARNEKGQGNGSTPGFRESLTASLPALFGPYREEEEVSASSSEDESFAAKVCSCACCSARCCGCACVLVSLLVLASVGLLLVHVGQIQVTRLSNDDSWHDASITPPDFPRYMGCGACKAGKKTDEEIKRCAEPCFSLEYVKDWETFAKAHDWKLVFFPSRPGPAGQPAVNISAWWLPADTSRLPAGQVPPRIVALHGLASNNNHCGVQSTCYLLRTMGFSCLTPTVRDYGLSGKSSHPLTQTWGYDYHYDLLGAWDYARLDPDGVLGGSLDAGQVGIMGFSRGGYDAAIAFGLDKRIPGAWLESAPFTGLYGMIDANIRPYAGPLTSLLCDTVYQSSTVFAGQYTVDEMKPLELLANCTGPQRKLMLSQGQMDKVVPVSETMEAALYLSSLTDCYEVKIFTPPSTCDGDTHHTFMWQFPDTGRHELCSFWSGVFGRDVSLCGPLDAEKPLQKVTIQEKLPKPPAYTS
eukprot:TRINITY_DN24976_c0_g1_i1.p1 TRINITY_DN24976_c0_g1~~TRINITY_DN24976_c0_g1_i1.p1  ORF type:complete len:575 (+),score=99.70 TRINITY_DN24976_c0_g1_i1:20-1744(+)